MLATFLVAGKPETHKIVRICGNYLIVLGNCIINMLFKMDKQEILKQHISRFVTLANEELSYFLSHFKEHSYKKSQVIISEVDRVENEYFVLTGYLKSFFIDEEMKMYILQFAMPSWWTSDYVAS
jgi:CRP-like cAMP-binding protein